MELAVLLIVEKLKVVVLLLQNVLRFVNTSKNHLNIYLLWKKIAPHKEYDGEGVSKMTDIQAGINMAAMVISLISIILCILTVIMMNR